MSLYNSKLNLHQTKVIVCEMFGDFMITITIIIIIITVLSTTSNTQNIFNPKKLFKLLAAHVHEMFFIY